MEATLCANVCTASLSAASVKGAVKLASSGAAVFGKIQGQAVVGRKTGSGSSRSQCQRVNAKRSGVVVTADASGSFDYDLVIIGAGVGGHGAALHAVEQVRSRLACITRPQSFSGLSASHDFLKSVISNSF